MNRYFLVFWVLTCASTALYASDPKQATTEQSFTNRDVISLTEAGLGDELVVAKIRQSKAATFDLSTAGLVALKKKNVSDRVIQAMLDWDNGTMASSESRVKDGSAIAPQPSSPQAAQEKPGRMSRAKGRLKSAVTRETPEEEAQLEVEERTQDAAAIGRDANDPCIKNFKREGGFVTGYKFSSFAEVSGRSKGQVFDQLIAYMAKEGWAIVSSNKDAGVISGAQGVIGSGRIVPINTVIEQSRDTVRVSLTFHIGSGMVAPAKGVQKGFCALIDAAQR